MYNSIVNCLDYTTSVLRTSRKECGIRTRKAFILSLLLHLFILALFVVTFDKELTMPRGNTEEKITLNLQQFETTPSSAQSQESEHSLEETESANTPEVLEEPKESIQEEPVPTKESLEEATKRLFEKIAASDMTPIESVNEIIETTAIQQNTQKSTKESLEDITKRLFKKIANSQNSPKKRDEKKQKKEKLLKVAQKKKVDIEKKAKLAKEKLLEESRKKETLAKEERLAKQLEAEKKEQARIAKEEREKEKLAKEKLLEETRKKEALAKAKEEERLAKLEEEKKEQEREAEEKHEKEKLAEKKLLEAARKKETLAKAKKEERKEQALIAKKIREKKKRIKEKRIKEKQKKEALAKAKRKKQQLAKEKARRKKLQQKIIQEKIRQKQLEQKRIAQKKIYKKKKKLTERRKKDSLANALMQASSSRASVNQSSSSSMKMIRKFYGSEFNSFTGTQKRFIKDNLNDIYRITQRTLTRNGYPEVAIRTQQQGTQIVTFYLHPNGNISKLRLKRRLGYSILDKNTIRVIKIAYKDYPKPKTTTKITFYVEYSLR